MSPDSRSMIEFARIYAHLLLLIKYIVYTHGSWDRAVANLTNLDNRANQLRN